MEWLVTVLKPKFNVLPLPGLRLLLHRHLWLRLRFAQLQLQW
jgi:hypothetical protein